MINILKQLEAWGIASRLNKFQSATLKLTFYYVLSTAIILCLSSVAVLLIFTPPETDVPFQVEDEHLEEELPYRNLDVYEVREHLSAVVIMVDITVILLVSVLSYFFARHTLTPIQDMYERQQQFMSDVAHELRTPLAVIKAGADTMLRKERPAKEYEDFVADVHSEAERLTSLTNQLLQLLRTEEVQIADFNQEDVSLLIEAEVKRFIPYATEHAVTITSDIATGLCIETEKDSLIEVVQNILKNAIDHNRPNGSVVVSLIDSEKTVVLEVKDTGVGIPEHKINSVFGRFTKGDTARTQTTKSGTGLGLAIVQALTAALGGTIALESTVDVGTTITITLPKIYS